MRLWDGQKILLQSLMISENYSETSKSGFALPYPSNPQKHKQTNPTSHLSFPGQAKILPRFSLKNKK
jgi:hypothetical protein